MILALVDHDRGRLDELSLEMLTFGRGLAERLAVPLHAVLIGEDARPLAERAAAFGAAATRIVLHERLDEYAPEAWAASLVQLMEATGPLVVVAPGSERANEVMAHVAARTGLPMAANCTEVEPGEGDGSYAVTRIRWGGSLLEDARLTGTVKLLTVAPHVVPAEPAAAASNAITIEPFTPVLTDRDLRVRVSGRIGSAGGTVSLAEAKVVVGGGRGVGSAAGFAPLEELAGLLGGAVGCSRVVTSLGWRPHSDQVGQTGTRIAPDLYIACGISGAIQHMVGCKGSKHILAINVDADAPIIALANSAVIGDVQEVVPALIAEIRSATGR